MELNTVEIIQKKEQLFKAWALQQNISLKDLFPTINKYKVHLLDLSTHSKWLNKIKEFNKPDIFQKHIEDLQSIHTKEIIAGGYLETRFLYTSKFYKKNESQEDRNLHLGIDFWLPYKTPVHAIWEGRVMVSTNDKGEKKYGGLVILEHTIKNLTFYSIYGHVALESINELKIGDIINKGDQIALLGNYPENGNWAPHLHFQITLSLLNYENDFPGVATQKEIDFWKKLCPNPNLLFQLDSLSN